MIEGLIPRVLRNLNIGGYGDPPPDIIEPVARDYTQRDIAFGEAIEAERVKVISLKGQIAASKALGAFVSIREMRATQRAFEAADIPLQQTRHGTIIPMTTAGQALTVQQHLLSEARETTSDIATDVYHYAGRTVILEEKTQDLFDEIAGLKQELEDRPVITETTSLFDFSGFGAGLGDMFGGIGETLKGALPWVLLIGAGYFLLRRKT